MAENIHRIEYPEDPDRCQAVSAKGQCTNKKVPGCTVCLVHGGAVQQQHNENARMDNYRVDMYKARMLRLKNSEGIKSLRDEIAILRMLLEEKLIQCDDPLKLMSASPDIADLVIKVDKVVNSCHKLESNMGQNISKTALITFAVSVVDVIKKEVEPQAAKIIAEKILALITVPDA